MNAKDQYEKYAVEAPSVGAFLQRYYKPDRLRSEPDFNEDRPQRLLAYYETEFATVGWTFISQHDGVTGQIVSLMRLAQTTGNG